MKIIVNPNLRALNAIESIQLPVYISFIGEFNEDNATKFYHDLNEAEKKCLFYGQDILPIIIESFGGEVYSLFAIIDLLKASRIKKIATIGIGKVISCGAALFSCGTEGYRFIAPNATVVIHEISRIDPETNHKTQEMKATTDEMMRLNKLFLETISKNCKKDKNYFFDLIHSKNHVDLYFNAKECIKHNIANHIGIPKFTVDIEVKYKFGL